MASGKKNYYRHSFFAIDDEKIQRVIDTMGFEGYGFYFSLLELIGRKCADEIQNPVTFHIQSLRNLWRKQTKSCRKVVEKLQESGLFVATFNENFVEFDIPNFAKYLGRYTNKKPPNTPNKRKEKERKEKKRKEKEIDKLTSGAIIDLFNSILGGQGQIGHSTLFLSREDEENFQVLIGFPEFSTIEGWKTYFGKVLQSPTLLGHNEDFQVNVTLSWLLRDKTAKSVMDGLYRPKNGDRLTGEGQMTADIEYFRKRSEGQCVN